VKARATSYGRSPSSVRIIAGVQPIIGNTIEEAQAQYQELQNSIHPEVGLARLSQLLDYDVTKLPEDAPLPELPDTENYKSRRALIIDMAKRENLDLGELYRKVVSAYGHRVVVGTPESVTYELAEWFLAGAVDGYIISPGYLHGLDVFNETVAPPLRGLGVLREEYEGTTLREHLGLDRPARGSWTRK
jgi:alkanesulfonate monooxygenase